MNYTFETAHLLDETEAVKCLLNKVVWSEDNARRVQSLAKTFIDEIRNTKTSITDIEQFLNRYPLSSPQGLALMSLAECLLRIPDTDTANDFIQDTLSRANWDEQGGDDFFGKSLRTALNLAQKTSSSGWLSSLGSGALRVAMTEMVKHLGSQFVIGETIQNAQASASNLQKQKFRLSYDMLGEGARTSDNAERYFQNYLNAIRVLQKDSKHDLYSNPSISVKLSALHPRYHWTHKDICLPIMIDKLKQLCIAARDSNIALTIDAEESDRLELSFEILIELMKYEPIKDWQGLGLAIQAYEKRCVYVAEYLIGLAKQYNRTLQIRLVKGAYWDTEIKRAQIAGLQNYPVFTRKINTDLSYLTTAQILLNASDIIYPMFATHNAYTAASILSIAKQGQIFEFQRLFGMGAALGDILRDQHNIPVSVYAPVGEYHDLLPYLVRRMLENSANTSFVSQIRDQTIETSQLIKDPVSILKTKESHTHKSISLPQNLFLPQRKNSSGIDLSHKNTRTEFLNKISLCGKTILVTNILNIDTAIKNARIEFMSWSECSVIERADILDKIGDLLEEHQAELIYYLQTEGHKTINDAIAEVREAIDFARYYASEARTIFTPEGEILKSYTGEDNRVSHVARGIFVAISPWNFPLAIFAGQVFAAIVSGNTVIAKPAEQTPIIARFCLQLFHMAGLPKNVVQLIEGDGNTGAELVAHNDIDGVVFTGSTQTAKLIEQSLAQKQGSIVPFIAETGGINAMIIDSTALLEQLLDDVMLSAFGSAGQRCSALRVLYVPRSVYPKIITLLKGALLEWNIGDAKTISMDMSRLIDMKAYQKIKLHCDYLESKNRLIVKSNSKDLEAPYIQAHIFELNRISELPEEIFGPVLHIIQYDPETLDEIINDINNTGYGLTFGVHTRRHSFYQRLARDIRAGNIYINRSMIGAVVGVQPFGGRGLSGTGPKAGGSQYLYRFATEKTITNNIVATGGNLKLLALPDDE
jgi:RHH-type proline utilization regulon transcriptional repressor/proline dehydrogenase/delta 1-pyrroline-5-carboxylate dehydrogenase